MDGESLNIETPPASPKYDISAWDTRFFGHPRGLATLFFTEMWERFSYYGMRALLILFMTARRRQGRAGVRRQPRPARSTASTPRCVYLLGLPGGWMADRLLGQRRAVFYGGVHHRGRPIQPGGSSESASSISGSS